LAIDVIVIQSLKVTPSLDPLIHAGNDADTINHAIPYVVWPELPLMADHTICALPPSASRLGARVPRQGGFQDT
jgi:hypothetical protein